MRRAAPRRLPRRLLLLLLLLLLPSLASASASEPPATPPAVPPPPPPSRSGRLRLAFTDEYRCTGAALDDPQRLRLKCRRAPARTADCLCSAAPGGAFAASLACACAAAGAGANASAGAPVRSFVPGMGVIEAAGLREPVRYL
jgi:hypothetical protein